MITIRKSDDRGAANFGWLDSKHTFSFNTYHDREHTHFRTLRVINDDIVQAGQGFGTHPHQDMEILTWVISGALAHKDSSGGGGVIRPGEIQQMSAGTGIYHSEFNHSKTEPVRFLQTWIFPERKGLKPQYTQTGFADAELRNQFKVVAAQGAPNGAVPLNQEAQLLVSRLDPGASATHTLGEGRGAYLQVARGCITLNGQTLAEGDGAKVTEEAALTVTGVSDAEVLLFDLA